MNTPIHENLPNFTSANLSYEIQLDQDDSLFQALTDLREQTDAADPEFLVKRKLKHSDYGNLVQYDLLPFYKSDEVIYIADFDPSEDDEPSLRPRPAFLIRNFDHESSYKNKDNWQLEIFLYERSPRIVYSSVVPPSNPDFIEILDDIIITAIERVQNTNTSLAHRRSEVQKGSEDLLIRSRADSRINTEEK